MYRKVQPGQRLSFPAGMFNRLADWAARDKYVPTPRGFPAPTRREVVRVRVSEDVEVGQLLRIGSLLTLPHAADGTATETGVSDFATHAPIFTDEDVTDVSPCGVVIQSCKSGDLARVAVVGLAACYVTILDDLHGFVDYDDVEGGAVTSPGGQFPIVWRETREEIEARVAQGNGDADHGWMLLDLSRAHRRGRFGVITDEGPSGEPEPSNCTYWVRLQVDDGTGTAADKLAVANEAERPSSVATPIIVLATNISELDSDSHSVPVGRVVELFASDAGGRRKWYFRYAV